MYISRMWRTMFDDVFVAFQQLGISSRHFAQICWNMICISFWKVDGFRFLDHSFDSSCLSSLIIDRCGSSWMRSFVKSFQEFTLSRRLGPRKGNYLKSLTSFSNPSPFLRRRRPHLNMLLLDKSGFLNVSIVCSSCWPQRFCRNSIQCFWLPPL